MTLADLDPLWLSVRLAAVTVTALLIVGTPLAWWLASTRSRLKSPIEALVALPIVLPPTVIGFYLLVLMGPNGPLGPVATALIGRPLTFTFSGLVLASMIYSLPFVVQPIQAALEQAGGRALEAAATLRAGPVDGFFNVAVPMATRGFVTAIVLGFAHTMGEFGIVLMVGGNIPGETRVISIALYENVEMLDYDRAHGLSAILLGFSFVALLIVYLINRRWLRI
ncbi:MAG: molybdate ABC transporter permease subunit [Alphaproteobacteria bacterium]|nr:molybdate ABC transporter permease subunit [Alphaproteobacteria bacterium]